MAAAEESLSLERAACPQSLRLAADCETLAIKKTLDIRNKTLGREHPDTGVTYYSLAKVCEAEGKYPAAEELYKEAFAICEEVLGKITQRQSRSEAI